MNDTLIKAGSLAYAYPFQSEPSLRGVSFELKRGEAMLVTGASGCGKSTLLRILNGLIPEHFCGTLDGKLEICGIACPAPLEQISRRVGTVLQCPEEQIMATTVEEECAIALEWRSTPRAEMRELVSSALDGMGISHLASRSVFSLSSGERQKCVIASVMAAKADIVVMDEPTANLSPEATEELAQVVKELKAAGIGVVIADHRLYWLEGIVDKAIVLEKGRMKKYLQNCNPLAALAADPAFPALELRALDVAKKTLPAAGSFADKAVEISNLSFRYRRKAPFIYNNFNASIPRGKITAVVGENGAGKTTLARLLCGLSKPSSGGIAFHEPARKTVSFVMQQMDIQLYMKSVKDELMFSARRCVPKEIRRQNAMRWLETFGLSHLENRHPHSLSGGEKQRLVVACALMKEPDLMILDEPTSGLDGRNMRIIANVLKSYAASGGTVLLITHDLELVSLAADCMLEVG